MAAAESRVAVHITSHMYLGSETWVEAGVPVTHYVTLVGPYKPPLPGVIEGEGTGACCGTTKAPHRQFPEESSRWL